MPFVLGERYEVRDRRLGGGACGDVWEGRDRHTGAPTAVKLAVPSSLQVSEEAIRDAFTREESALRQIEHPNVVALLDSGVYEDRPFLVLEYVSGKSLWEIFQSEKANPTLTMLDKIRLLSEVARAVGEVHVSGFVHLDLKPENILVTPTGRAVLIDFGSSLSIEQARVRPVEIESRAYCSPEQIRGTRWCNGAGLTPRTDVFAFGVVAWEILCLHRPFGEATAGHLQRIANENPQGSLQQWAPECPAELARMVGVCLSKNPKGRYASMGAVAQRIENIGALLTSQQLHEEGRIEAAIQKAEEVIAASPDLEEARHLAFNYSKEHIAALIQHKEAEKAREFLQRAKDHCSSNPERLAYIENLEKELGANIFAERQIRALISRAERDLQAGSSSAAAEYIAMAEKVDSSHPLLQEFHRSRYAEIEQLLRVPDYPGALARWRSWLTQAEQEKHFPGAIAELERLRRKIWKEAESDVEQKLFLHDFPAANSLLGALERCSSVDRQSRGHIQKLTRMVKEHETSYADSLHMENLDLVSEGRFEEALNRVRRALEMLPQDVGLLSAETGLARSLAESREVIQSIRRNIEKEKFDAAAVLIEKARSAGSVQESALSEFDGQLQCKRAVSAAICEVRQLADAGQMQEAIDAAAKSLQRYPAELRLLKLKSELESRLREAAIAQFAEEIEDALACGALELAGNKLSQSEIRYPGHERFAALARNLAEAKCRVDEETHRAREAEELRRRQQEQESQREIELLRQLNQSISQALSAARAGQFQSARSILDACRQSVGDRRELAATLSGIEAQERAQTQAEQSERKRREAARRVRETEQTQRKTEHNSSVNEAIPAKPRTSSRRQLYAAVILLACLFPAIGAVTYLHLKAPPSTVTAPQITRHVPIDARPSWGTVKYVSPVGGGKQIQVNQPTPCGIDVAPGEYEIVAVDQKGKEHSRKVNVNAFGDADPVIFEDMDAVESNETH